MVHCPLQREGEKGIALGGGECSFSARTGGTWQGWASASLTQLCKHFCCAAESTKALNTDSQQGVPVLVPLIQWWRGSGESLWGDITVPQWMAVHRARIQWEFYIDFNRMWLKKEVKAQELSVKYRGRTATPAEVSEGKGFQVFPNNIQKGIWEK